MENSPNTEKMCPDAHLPLFCPLLASLIAVFGPYSAEFYSDGQELIQPKQKRPFIILLVYISDST